ncbi:MAG: cupin domain-containing protein [Rhizobiaceae bacterium]
MPITPIADPEIIPLRVGAGGQVPNNPKYPAVLARKALGGPNDDGAVRALMARNGWGATWTWRVFDYHHFHPDAFEALAVAQGSATLMLGGPQGQTIEVEAGDVMILPPGFGHCQIAMRDGFQICGAYPPGQENYTVVRGSDGYDDRMLAQIAAVPPPSTDPIWGARGQLLRALLGAEPCPPRDLHLKRAALRRAEIQVRARRKW